MARQKVVQVKCDRCKRTNLQQEEEGDTFQPDFVAQFLGKMLKYDDVCAKCRLTLENLWKGAEEWDREAKQSTGPTINGEKAPPAEVPALYVSPKPHAGHKG